MTVSFLLAMGLNREIGKDNKLPWRLPADLAYVKQLTMGHTLLMGRKTYESIGKPLPGRNNVIMTRDANYRPEGCMVVHTVEEALAAYGDEELFVFGGAEIYRLFMPYADKLYITRIAQSFAADTYFPELDGREWELVSSRQGVTDEKNPYTYYFEVYTRKRD